MDLNNFRLFQRWTPAALKEAKDVFRQGGLRGVIRRYGWKFFAVFFAYYLIRDITIYILLPWYLTQKVL